MTSEELLLLLHLSAVIAWLGANVSIDLLWLRAERMRDPAEMAKMGVLQEWLTPRLFIPAALATLLFGLLLVADSDFWSFGDLWVVLGLLAFIATFLNGILFLKPQGEKMGEIIARHGPTSPEALRHGKRLLVVARVQLLLLFLVVADMVLKPTSDDPWTLVVLAAILAAGIAAGVAVVRRSPASEGAPAVESR